MRWLCVFFPCRWQHIRFGIWQCTRCKTCSLGRVPAGPGRRQMTQTTPHHRLLHLRILALRNVTTGWQQHEEEIVALVDRPVSRLGVVAWRINNLAWRYRAQISPELVPWRVS